ncbi:SCO-spondin [Frankliniella fusca]|uniref:SCO-spondin n=1 Tax=Frankliniella fusca TaxID=407009 RepID=A0AAE1HM24_9NEOP|nr:SCO-spondin [Frankliniella fusca]
MPRPSTLLAVLVVALVATVGGVQGDEMVQIPGYDWIKMSIMSGWELDQEDAPDDRYPKRVSEAAPPIPAYMGSLDYGGQPPSYKLSEVKASATWPVDRSQGAPAALHLHPTAATVTADTPSKAEQYSKQHAKQQAGSRPGFNLLHAVLGATGRVVEAVKHTVGSVVARVGLGRAAKQSAAEQSTASRRWPSLSLSNLPLIGKMLSALTLRLPGRKRSQEAVAAREAARTARQRRRYRSKLPAWLLEIVEQEERELPHLEEVDSGSLQAGRCPYFHKAAYGDPVMTLLLARIRGTGLRPNKRLKRMKRKITIAFQDYPPITSPSSI